MNNDFRYSKIISAIIMLFHGSCSMVLMSVLDLERSDQFTLDVNFRNTDFRSVTEKIWIYQIYIQWAKREIWIQISQFFGGLLRGRPLSRVY